MGVQRVKEALGSSLVAGSLEFNIKSVILSAAS